MMLAPKIAPGKENPDTQVEDIRKIIKDGNIRLETTDAKETKIRILEQVAAHKGYVLNDYANTFAEMTEYTITIRIPATGFDQIIERITGLAKRIESQHVSSLDVTEEFSDVNSRLNRY